MILNSHILSSRLPENGYCISVRIARRSEQDLVVKVLDEDPGVKINPSDDPHDFTISQLRDGSYPDLWLLSGGLLIFSTDDFSLAMGERNDRSVDPYCWTNIVSGRCDRYWKAHIADELGEEWLAFGFVKRSKRWYRLTVNLFQLPAIAVPPIAESFLHQIPSYYKERSVSIKINQTGDFLSLNTFPFWKRIDIFWPDKSETFSGIVMIDEENHTIEIRQPAVVDLINFSTKKLLYPEGTGRADWFPLRELIYLREKELAMEENHFTPFIRFLLDGLRNRACAAI